MALLCIFILIYIYIYKSIDLYKYYVGCVCVMYAHVHLHLHLCGDMSWAMYVSIPPCMHTHLHRYTFNTYICMYMFIDLKFDLL